MDDFTFFQNKKVLVFDLDGTIVNLTADWPSLKKILKDRYNEIYEDSCEFKSMSACLREIVRKDDEETLHEFFDIIRTYELKNFRETTLIEEIVYFIRNRAQFGIKKEVKLAILSLNTRITIEKSLELANLMVEFDFVVGREDVRRWKPDPEGLFKIRDHFKVKENDMIFFGDLENDIKTGIRAGVDTYYIDIIINLVKKFNS
jgi:HAD superfamily hydrolase (TIGR01549 family)